MSRHAPKGPPARERGWVYTLHLDPPLEHAKHYTGWKKDVEGQEKDIEHRLAEHEAGRGARLTQIQLQRGGTWRLAGVDPGTRDRETQLKERGASRRCPICIVGRVMQKQAQQGKETEAQAEPELEAG